MRDPDYELRNTGSPKISLWYDHDDKAWFASFPDLPGCIADGATELEALRNAKRVKKAWIKSATEEGWKMPGTPPRWMTPREIAILLITGVVLLVLLVPFVFLLSLLYKPGGGTMIEILSITGMLSVPLVFLLSLFYDTGSVESG